MVLLNRRFSFHPAQPTTLPINTLIAAIGSSRINAIYHSGVNLAQSGGSLVSWDDARGPSGFGPQLLPNAGLGGTAPTIDGNGRVVTNGTTSYFAPASASSKFPLDTSKRTSGFAGEMLGTSEWGGFVSALSSPTNKQTWGWVSGGFAALALGNAANTTISVAKAQPGAGVESCFLQSNRNPEDWSNQDQYLYATPSPDVTVAAEIIGRGPAKSIARSNRDSVHTTLGDDPIWNSATSFMCWGRVDSTYSVVKARFMFVMNDVMTWQDRAALETFLATESVAMYTPSGSKGLIIMMGDSITAGANTTDPAFDTPSRTSGTGPGSYLQTRLNAASKPIDVASWGLGGQNLNVMGKTQSPNTTPWTDSQLAFLSPARRAAGFKDIIIHAFGTNDLGPSQARTAAQVYADITTYVASVHAAGGKIVLGTVIPRGNFNSTVNGIRVALNALIVTNSAGADAIANHATTDAGGGVLPFADNQYGSQNLTYYCSALDLTHLKDAGEDVESKTYYDTMIAAGMI